MRSPLYSRAGPFEIHEYNCVHWQMSGVTEISIKLHVSLDHHKY